MSEQTAVKDKGIEEAVENFGAAFVDTLIALKGGAVIHEFGDRLRSLIAAVRDTERGGSLTMTIKVAPATSGSAEVVTVEAELKEKIPRPSLGKTIFFTTPENLLVRQDPRQLALNIERASAQ